MHLAVHLAVPSLILASRTRALSQVELGVLTAQSAFVDQSRGDIPSAEKAYQTLFAFKADLDPAVTAVAANNMVRIRGQRDFFDSWKKCKANLTEALAKKLTPAQRLAFLTNGKRPRARTPLRRLLVASRISHRPRGAVCCCGAPSPQGERA